MSKVSPARKDGEIIGYIIMCPACGFGHCFYTNYKDHPNWSFNGDLEKPTFSPSMLIHESPTGEIKRCHSFVRNGNIEFLTDCGHSMAGKTVSLPEM
jgi:Family of unknown function (DUF6527)